MTWRGVSESVVIWVPAAVASYDVFARVCGGNDATISAVVSDAVRRWPVVALAIGGVVSHWVWGGARG